VFLAFALPTLRSPVAACADVCEEWNGQEMEPWAFASFENTQLLHHEVDFDLVRRQALFDKDEVVKADVRGVFLQALRVLVAQWGERAVRRVLENVAADIGPMPVRLVLGESGWLAITDTAF
jgi:hypothetical protein